ncbi:MAG: hypothetical protein HOC74_07335 [Gemmatimonadetes bacterium]|jgi:hypothetical protein|nr:hypothetical protein [Gemmatimonadota bacterium]
MAELLSIERLFGDGYHNAFTDLKFWKGRYYLCFRTAQSHGVTDPGDVVVYRSADLEEWSPCARFDTGGDDRDPKLIDAGERLGVVFGTWFPRWGADGRSVRSLTHDLISHISVSRDGSCWSTPRQMYGVNYWMWRVLSAAEGFYCAAYHFGRRDDRDMRTVHLLFSQDLFDWRLKGLMRSGGGAGESVLFQSAPGELSCVTRTLEPNHHSWIGRSRKPYMEWEWEDLGVMIHAPVVLEMDGRWIVAGRSQEADLPAESFGRHGEHPTSAEHHTSVWTLEGNRAVHELTVPSNGDCSYAGLASGLDGEILMSYYSQHERLPLPTAPPAPADIFLARFSL